MPEWVWQIVGVVVTGGFTAAGVYAAIRADLAAIREKAHNAHEAAQHAHGRIDRILEGHRHG